MQNTPQANRIHISIFGRANAGKSTLLNAITGQNTALTSPERGTTTDPVYKAMEIAPLGACLLIDTAGIDDDTVLGEQRIERTRKIMDKTDIALLLLREENLIPEKEWMKELKNRKIPIIYVINQDGSLEKKEVEAMQQRLTREEKETAVVVNALTGEGLETLYIQLEKKYADLEQESSICGHLVEAGDNVLLVMPQDIQAPKGRLILPQVQTIRELLDRNCFVHCTGAENFIYAIRQLAKPPKLIITDSQLFAQVAKEKPEESLLTSFSVLFSRYKGDIEEFLAGAKCLKNLKAESRILIAEACTHKPLEEDIGRVKLPRLLRNKFGEKLKIEIVSGAEYPEDLSQYDLIIHCGACMFNRRHVLSRLARAKEQEIPITNYGVAIAALTGILEDVVY